MTSYGKLKIDSHDSMNTADWTIELNGVDISNSVNKIVIESDAMQIPVVTLRVVTDLEISLDAEINIEKLQDDV